MPAKPKTAVLNAREARFAAEYVIDCNATQAAIRAGYAPKAAGQQGYDLLKRPHIAAKIKELGAKQEQRLEVTADRIIQEIAKIAFSNPANYLVIDSDGTIRPDFSRMTRHDMAAISQIEFDVVKGKVKPVGRRRKNGRAGGKPPVETRLSLVSKIKTWDKGTALQLLGRSQGIFSDSPPPPPDPNKDVKRQTLIRVLIQNLEGKAAAVHVQVDEDGKSGKVITGSLAGSAKALADARRAQKR